PCNNEGEDARLYEAVQGVSDFAISLGINIPTGKDSLSMKQRYKDGNVLAPGTVIISAAGHCEDVKKVVEPVLQKKGGDIYYINFSGDDFKLGGSSFGQIVNRIGKQTPTVKDDKKFSEAFNTIQELIKQDLILAGHDIASGGLITTLLEMCFADVDLSAELDLSALGEEDIIKLLFSENCGIIFQAKNASVEDILEQKGIGFFKIGKVTEGNLLKIKNGKDSFEFDIPKLRDTWSKTSFLLDEKQSGIDSATERYRNYAEQPLHFRFPENFDGKIPTIPTSEKRIKAAIIREKGSNSEREMAYAMDLAGFDVKDVHMTDLISGRETLEDIQFIAAVGGFSNSDVLGSAKGWAGAFLYNKKAKTALDNFFAREDTLSLGVCNGCQLFMELGLLHPEHEEKPKMLHNESHKFECNFTSVELAENDSVMLHSLSGTRLGIWAAHGEGKFSFPYEEERYKIIGKYGYEGYPANPNGSHYNTAIIASDNGRHLAMMPHLERSTFPWNWAYYPKDRKDEVSPWIEAFVNARKWLEKQK
ncbi:MAG: phosphoribosylformylglycinamidine synthase subunit PurQ, partial [Salinimicrobium sp.]